MLFIDKNPKSILAEKYRQLRTSIEYSSIDKKIKTIAITSSEMGEGKSTVAINLACTLGKANKKVIVIDCDLRKPTVHRKLELSNEKGITDYLLGKKELRNVIQCHKAGFHALTSGNLPPNPAEIVDSKSMEELISLLSEEYDYVVIDTPPVRVVTDGAVIAGKADGTLLVVRAEYAKEDSIKKGYEELKKVNANIMGTVLNAVEDSHSSYKYDGYYSDEQGKKKKKALV